MGSVVNKIKDTQHKILNKKYIEYLCDDVWITIFSFLTANEFCTTISIVCNYFHKITHYTNNNIQNQWKCRCMKKFASILAKLKLQDGSYNINYWHKLFGEMQQLTNMLEKKQIYEQYPFYIQLCISDSINLLKIMSSHSSLDIIGQHTKLQFERSCQDELCDTPLQFATSHRSCNILKYYLEDHVLDLSWKECGVLLQTCLFPPNTWKRLDISSTMSTLKIILQNPNCNQKSINYASRQVGGLSLLMLACQSGHYKAVPLLLRYGANVNQTTIGGSSFNALYFAIKCLDTHHLIISKSVQSTEERERCIGKYLYECKNIISMWTHIINHKDIDFTTNSGTRCIPPLHQITKLKKRNGVTISRVLYTVYLGM